jgi:hypothetical protein
MTAIRGSLWPARPYRTVLNLVQAADLLIMSWFRLLLRPSRPCRRGESTATHTARAKFQINLSTNLYSIFSMLWYQYRHVPGCRDTMLVADSRGHMCLRSSDMAKMGPNAAIQGYPCLLKPKDFQSKSVQKRRKKTENLKYGNFLMFGRQNLVLEYWWRCFLLSRHRGQI